MSNLPQTPMIKHKIKEYIQELSAYGYPSYTIADRVKERFGLDSYSDSTVRVHRSRIRKHHLKRIEDLHDNNVARQIATLHQVRRDAYEAFQKTLQPYRKDILLDGQIFTLESSQTPGAQFLNIVLSTLAQEATLLGLDAPRRHEINAKVQTLDWNQLLSPPKPVEGGYDRVAAAIAEVMALPEVQVPEGQA